MMSKAKWWCTNLSCFDVKSKARQNGLCSSNLNFSSNQKNGFRSFEDWQIGIWCANFRKKQMAQTQIAKLSVHLVKTSKINVMWTHSIVAFFCRKWYDVRSCEQSIRYSSPCLTIKSIWESSWRLRFNLRCFPYCPSSR